MFSGIQPTGNLHLGNYLGAIKNWVEIQNSGEYTCFFSVVDYHSLSGGISSEERREQIARIAAELIAAGIDPDKSTLFVQSHVPEHTELAWIFNCLTPVAELERMTQFKDKSKAQAKNINAGLFTYPVLQAADILLYHGTHVPVGEDQIQHVELTRNIARWFNKRYGDYFPETKVILTKTPRVKSLLDPAAKMSKSKGAGHVIELADEPELVFKKMKKAVTATEGGGRAPGVENLFVLLKEFAPEEIYTQFKQEEKNASIQYGSLKEELGRCIGERFAEFRERRRELLDTHDELAEVLAKGAEKAQHVAIGTIKRVREMIGVR
ncbi:MAG: tryptophan--tRNA ligase [Candidatus Magasanikbacteria bacterium]|nr:tryptophan--tRNA ligase [Candidatus Magasanikbacteria bacterium]